MRIRHAATALLALGAASACALGGSVIHQADTARDDQESALRSSAWSVQASTDFGTNWTAPVSKYGGHFPVRVDTAALRGRPAYQPLTLRTSVDSQAGANVSFGAGALIEGDPAVASELRIRAVKSAEGTCAAPTFANGSRNLLDADGTQPQPVNTPTVDQALRLPGATRTTSGVPVTVCLEVSIAPGTPVADGQVTLGWPITVTRVDDQS